MKKEEITKSDEYLKDFKTNRDVKSEYICEPCPECGNPYPHLCTDGTSFCEECNAEW